MGAGNIQRNITFRTIAAIAAIAAIASLVSTSRRPPSFASAHPTQLRVRCLWDHMFNHVQTFNPADIRRTRGPRVDSHTFAGYSASIRLRPTGGRTLRMPLNMLSARQRTATASAPARALPTRTHAWWPIARRPSTRVLAAASNDAGDEPDVQPLRGRVYKGAIGLLNDPPTFPATLPLLPFTGKVCHWPLPGDGMDPAG